MLFVCFDRVSIRTPEALAGPLDNPSPIPGWTHSPALVQDTPGQHGIIIPGNGIVNSSPVIAEIDGDVGNGKEVAVASAGSQLFVYRSNGTLLWTAPLPNFGCGNGSNRMFSSPAVGTLFGNGVPYVVIGYGGFLSKNCDGGVSAFRGSDGALAWNFSIKQFGKRERFRPFRNGVYSSPAVADVDGDGTMEVGFGSFDHHVYLLNADGSVRWYYNAGDTVWSSPAFFNVDDDPDLEMIIGTDISANKKMRPRTYDGGFVYAFKTKPLVLSREKANRRRARRLSFRQEGTYIWQTFLDQVVFSSPIVADVLPSNPGKEIIVGSGCYFPDNSNDKRGKWVKILRPRDGAVIQTLNATACFSSNLAVGDIDDDGVNEVVATVNGSKSIGGDGDSRVTAWNAEDPNPIWSIVPKERGRNDSWGGTLMSPVIADLDGNGSLEVLAANGGSVGIYNGKDGAALTCQELTCTTPSLMLFTWRSVRSTPAVGDINNDGILDVVVGGAHPSTGGLGVLYGWTNIDQVLETSSGEQTPYAAPWPMYRGNSQHTAVAGD